MNRTLNLIIDIGNTRAKLVVFDDDKIVEQTYSDSQTLDQLDTVLSQYRISKGIISSVAHIGKEAEERLSCLPFPLTRLDSETPLPFPILWRIPGNAEPTPLPHSMGADRIAALIGAIKVMPDTPLLIIDAGTCVTYEIIDNEGYYIGGNIAPGLQMRLAAMHDHTALLPLVDAKGDLPIIGYDTETCMRCGVINGLQYEIEGYVKHWQSIYPSIKVFLTGGDHFSFNKETEPLIHRDNYLVPKGLNCILNAL